MRTRTCCLHTHLAINFKTNHDNLLSFRILWIWYFEFSTNVTVTHTMRTYIANIAWWRKLKHIATLQYKPYTVEGQRRPCDSCHRRDPYCPVWWRSTGQTTIWRDAAPAGDSLPSHSLDSKRKTVCSPYSTTLRTRNRRTTALASVFRQFVTPSFYAVLMSSVVR